MFAEIKNRLNHVSHLVYALEALAALNGEQIDVDTLSTSIGGISEAIRPALDEARDKLAELEMRAKAASVVISALDN